MKEYGYITLKSFEAIREHKFPLLIGEHLIIISNLQLNIHKIDSQTLPHSHSDNQIIYYIKGSGKEIIDKKEFSVFPGSIVFIPEKKKHSFIPYAGTSAEVFTLRFETTRSIIKKIKGKEKEFLSILKLLYSKNPNSWNASLKRREEIESLIGNINETLKEKKFGYLITLNGYLLLLLREFLISMVERKKDEEVSVKDKLFININNYLKDNFDKDIGSKDVAALFKISQNYLQKIIKTYTGYSFTRYFNGIKIDYAKKLLKETTLEIKEIAGKIGIYDINYFSRLFRMIEGIPPSKMRRI